MTRRWLLGGLLAVAACAGDPDRDGWTPERAAQMDEATRIRRYAEIRAARSKAAADDSRELERELVRLKLARWERERRWRELERRRRR